MILLEKGKRLMNCLPYLECGIFIQITLRLENNSNAIVMQSKAISVFNNQILNK